MMDRDARRAGALAPSEIVDHGEDIRRPLGITDGASTTATVACLDLYRNASFPLGTKKRIAGLRLVATDVDWSHGTGTEVSGPGLSLLLAMTGRNGGLDQLTGDGVTTLRTRLEPTHHEESRR